MDERKSEQMGSYELVAAKVSGRYQGAVWLLGEDGKREKIEASEGASIDEVLSGLRSLVNERLQNRALAADGATPDVASLVKSFRRMAGRLSEGQLKMLCAHYNAPDRRCTASELATAAGWKTFSLANLHYGTVGWWLYCEHPRVLPIDEKTGKAITTFMLADGAREGKEDWVWTMHPYIAEALEASGLMQPRARSAAR
ncbi:MAG: hypothetical protein KGI67_07185 [Pseudomonadota bacterium]|nr:hypothetical protein [Pseudomonadota bacterium]